ncbi:hypothetical protein BGX23_010533 [Mortierella sp. AD031]|nr:hypothetical protein BGX23_010533 [Mortierella sp. AD031]KAG0201416.1 hypothetical protein BGX33_010333 [Mortierella sp. NVP41]
MPTLSDTSSSEDDVLRERFDITTEHPRFSAKYDRQRKKALMQLRQQYQQAQQQRREQFLWQQQQAQQQRLAHDGMETATTPLKSRSANGPAEESTARLNNSMQDQQQQNHVSSTTVRTDDSAPEYMDLDSEPDHNDPGPGSSQIPPLMPSSHGVNNVPQLPSITQNPVAQLTPTQLSAIRFLAVQSPATQLSAIRLLASQPSSSQHSAIQLLASQPPDAQLNAIRVLTNMVTAVQPETSAPFAVVPSIGQLSTVESSTTALAALTVPNVPTVSSINQPAASRPYNISKWSIRKPKPIVYKPRRKPTSKSSAPTDASKRFKCEFPTCGREFSRLFNMRSHAETHDLDREKPFLCEDTTCNKRFARKHDLLRHEASVHQGLRKYHCAYCDTQFSRRDGLRRHLSREGTMCGIKDGSAQGLMPPRKRWERTGFKP